MYDYIIITNKNSRRKNKKRKKCKEHTNWCSKYKFKTDEKSCKLCSSLEGEDKIWLIQNLSAIRNINNQHKCIYFKELDEYEEKKCCGGSVKRIRKVWCDKINNTPDCNNCKHRKIC